MKTDSRRLASAISALVWAGVLLYFCASGRINAYLVPGFRAYAVLGGLTLAVVGLFTLLTHRRDPGCGHEGCDGHHDDGDIPPAGILACMALPILSTSSLATDSFSLRALTHKGAFDEAPKLTNTLTSTEIPSRRTIETERPRNTRGFIVLDLLEIHFSAMDAEYARNMEGLDVSIQGRVLDGRSSAAKNSVIYRLLLTCCAADGRPLSVRTEIPPDIPPPAANAWMELEGVLSYERNDKGNLTPVLRVARATPREAPAEEYLLRY